MLLRTRLSNLAQAGSRVFLLAALFALLGSPGTRGDEGGGKTYNGSFSAELQPPPGCTSPVGICTHGYLAGDLNATYDFTMTELFPANDDPDHPNKLYYLGNSVITTEKGEILAEDTGVMYFDPTDESPFMTTANIVGGTHRYQHASGQFVATGSLILTTGAADGGYTANIVHGNGGG
jgi:hypothetical protein